MIGLIDVGGGMRDVYGAGVLDYCLDNNINFDYCIGVSAGSANCASFVAKQRGRNYPFYYEYINRKEYMSLSNYIKKGSYLDLNYVYGELSNTDGENPLDYDAMMKNNTIFKVVATNAVTGEAEYFDKRYDMHLNDYRFLMASCCFPIACKPVRIGNKEYYDGGISNPIPIQKALEDGCDKIVLILTKPVDETSLSKRNLFGSYLLKGKYRKTAEALRERNVKYNNAIHMAQKLENKVLIVAPNDIGKMKTLTKDPKQIDKLYNQGYKDAEKIKEFLLLDKR